MHPVQSVLLVMMYKLCSVMRGGGEVRGRQVGMQKRMCSATLQRPVQQF